MKAQRKGRIGSKLTIRKHDRRLHGVNERIVLVVRASVPPRQEAQLGMVDGSVEEDETVHEARDGKVGKHSEDTQRGEVLGAVDEPREDVENDRALQTLSVRKRQETHLQRALEGRFERRAARLHVLSEGTVDRETQRDALDEDESTVEGGRGFDRGKAKSEKVMPSHTAWTSAFW